MVENMPKFAMMFTNSCMELGLWNIVESCKYFKEKSLTWHPDLSMFCGRFWRNSPIVEYQWQEIWMEMTVLARLYHSLKLKSNNAADTDTQKHVAEFQRLLKNISEKHSEIAEELWQLFLWRVCMGQKNTSLTEKTLSVLSDYLCYDPVCAHSFISFILPKFPHSSETTVEWLNVYMGVLKKCSHEPFGEMNIESFHLHDKKCKFNVEIVFLSILALIYFECDGENLGEWLYLYLNSLASHVLPVKQLYFSLLSHSKLTVLQYIFTENEKNHYSNYDVLFLSVPNSWITYGKIEASDLFHVTLKSQCHWVEGLLETAFYVLTHDRDTLCQWSYAMQRLLPLLLPQLWVRANTGKQLMHWLHQLGNICKDVSCDPLLRHLGTILEQQVQLLAWCSTHRQKCTLSSTEILHISARASTLKTLWMVTDLSVTNWREVRELLVKRQTQSCDWGEQDRNCASVTIPSWDVTVFEGYCILMTCFDAIQSIESLNVNCHLQKYENCLKFSSDVKKGGMEKECSFNSQYNEVHLKLQKVQEAICSLFPLHFRIEILENIFSLLFLNPNYMEESSDSDTSLEEGTVEECQHDADTALESSIGSSVASFLNVLELSENKLKNAKSCEITSDECDLLSSGNLDDCSTFMTKRSQHTQGMCDNRSELEFVERTWESGELYENSKKHIFHYDSKEIYGTDKKSFYSNVQLQTPQETSASMSLTSTTSHAEEKNTAHQKNIFSQMRPVTMPVQRRQPFVCNHELVDVMLAMLTECLVQTKGALYQQHSTENVDVAVSDSLVQRIQRLSLYITEAVWRVHLFGGSLTHNGALQNVNKETDGTFTYGRGHVSPTNCGNFVQLHQQSDSRGFGSCIRHDTRSKTVGYIAQLLSSPSSLAVQCLAQGRLEEAQQVVQMHQLSSALVSDIAFTASLQRMRSRLRSSIRDTGHGFGSVSDGLQVTAPESISLPRTPNLLLQSVRQVATEGAFTAWVTREVGIFLSSTPLPHLSEAQNVMAEFPASEGVLGVCTSGSTLALVDVLLTTSATPEHSVALLSLLEQCAELSLRPSAAMNILPKGQVLGSGQFIQGLVESFRLANKDNSDGVLPSHLSICSLLHSHLYPSLFRGIKENLQFWRILTNKTESCEKFVWKYYSHEEEIGWTKLLQSDILSDFVQLCASIDMCAGFMSPEEEICGRQNYMDKLFFYMTYLSACFTENCAEINVPEHVLGNSLRQQLGTHFLQLDCQQDHETHLQDQARLEAMAHLVHHNLVHSMTCALWPKSLQAADEAPIRPVVFQGSGHGYRVVLNHQDEQWVGPVEPPSRAVAGLLGGLLAALSAASEEVILNREDACTVTDCTAVQWVLDQTASLSLLDLSQMKGGNDALAFYTNLANLAWLHTMLVFETRGADFGLLSPSGLQRTFAQYCVGYLVGLQEQIFVSLYTLQHTLCGTVSACPCLWNLQESFELICPQDQRVGFFLAVGHELSPKVQVLNEQCLDVQLNTAVIEYLNFQLENFAGSLCLPEVLAPSLENVSSGDLGSDYLLSDQNSKNKETMTSRVSPCTSELIVEEEQNYQSSTKVLQIFIKMLDDNLFANLHDEVLKFLQHVAGFAKFVNSDYKFIIRLRECPKMIPKSTKNESKLEYNKNHIISEGALNFVESHCWLLSVVVARLLQDGDACNLTELSENLLETWAHTTKHLRRLLVSRPVAVLSTAFGGGPAICALQLPFALKRVLPHVAFLLDSGRVEEALGVLWILPEKNIQEQPGMSVLYDALLFSTVSTSGNKGNVLPWRQCLLLEDQVLAARCVLQHMSHWPHVACQHVLSAIVGEGKQPVTPTLRVLLRQHLLCIQVQGKLNVCWAEQHAGVTPQKLKVDAEFILRLLEQKKYDFTVVEQLLLALPPRQAFTICEEMLKRIESITCKKSLVAFVVDVLHESLTTEERTCYTMTALGVRMLDFLVPVYQEAFWDLVFEPQLILEQLLMNSQFRILEQIISSLHHTLAQFPPSSLLSINNVDALLRSYAARALECRVGRPDGSIASDQMDQLFPPLEEKSDEAEGTQSPFAAEGIQTSISGKTECFVMPAKVPSKAEWMPDNKATECLCCKTVTFSMFNRRHHCRRCGRLVCAGCSTTRTQVEGYGQVAVRVCDACARPNASAAEAAAATAAALAGDDGSGDEATLAPDAAPPLPWRLARRADHDATIRGEFSYTRAPSVALCLSALQAHSESAACPRFLVSASAQLLQLLAPVGGGAPNPEVDAALVLRMVRSLLVAAKLKYARRAPAAGEAQCDALLRRVDLLALLETGPGGCSALASTLLSSPAAPSPAPAPALRALRARLLALERWPLAVDVCTKAGLDAGAAWAAWGRACLRAGRWRAARDKFSRCMAPAAIDSAAPPATSVSETPALADVLQLLQSGACVAPAHSDDQESAEPLLAALGALEDVAHGRVSQTSPPAAAASSTSAPWAARAAHAECLYYLSAYGGSGALLAFLAGREGGLSAALRHVRDASVDPETFTDALYLRCLREGRTAALHAALRDADPSLRVWQAHLQHACAALARRDLLHSLYRLQLFCGDLLRASMTCVRFYAAGARCFGDLARAAHHLQAAESHLQAYLEEQLVPIGTSSAGGGPSAGELPLRVDARQVDAHICSVRRQAEVARFLASCEARGARPLALARELWPPLPPPHSVSALPSPHTLFGGGRERVQLAALAILCGRDVEEGFGVAFRIIQDYHLKYFQVYGIVVRRLAHESRIADVERFIACIRQSGITDTSALCDQVLTAALQVLSEKGELNLGDKLVKLMDDIPAKITMYIETHQLKSAYLLAVKSERYEDIHKIMNEAKRLGQHSIQRICAQKLNLPI